MPVAIFFRVALRQSGGDGVDLRLRLRQRGARGKTRDCILEMHAALIRGFGVSDPKWDEQLRLAARQLEAGRHHSHDGVVLTGKVQYASQSMGIASQPLLPEVVTDDHDWLATELVILRRKRSSQFGINAQRLEKTHGNQVGFYLLRLALDNQIEMPIGKCAKLSQLMTLLLKILQVRLRLSAVDGDQLRSLRVGQRAQQDRVDDAK